MFAEGAGLAGASSTDAAVSAAGPSRESDSESEESEAPITTALMVQEEAENISVKEAVILWLAGMCLLLFSQFLILSTYNDIPQIRLPELKCLKCQHAPFFVPTLQFGHKGH